MDNKELSKAIATALKEAGFQRKDFSIRSYYAGYEQACRIEIKNPLVRLSEVEAIAKRFSQVDYDSRSMEILAGGNTFIHVNYEYGLFDEVAKDLEPIAEKVIESGKYDGLPIASNSEKTVNFIVYNRETREFLISEHLKENDPAYHPNYWIRSARDLAIAMYRFKNIGTIYA
jgi:hypothetical protein